LISVVSNALLGLLVFGLSASVDVAAFKDKLKKRNGILIGLACQFFLLPFVGFLTVVVFQLKEVYGVTLLIVCSSPGGSYSNLWCSLFNSDLALSVAMTTASTLVSTFMLPVNLLLYITLAYGNSDAADNLDWVALFLSISVVMLAVGCGLLVSSRATDKAQSWCALFGNLAGLTLVLFSVLVSSRDEPIWNKPPKFYFAIALPCLGGLTLAILLTSCPSCGLKKPERVSVAIETCYQNVGVATAVALSMFKGKEQSQAVGVPLYYGLVEAVLLAIFCLYAWKAGWTFAPASARKVLGFNDDHVRNSGNNDNNNNSRTTAMSTVVQNQQQLNVAKRASGAAFLTMVLLFVEQVQLELRAFRFILANEYQPRSQQHAVVENDDAGNDDEHSDDGDATADAHRGGVFDSSLTRAEEGNVHLRDDEGHTNHADGGLELTSFQLPTHVVSQPDNESSKETSNVTGSSSKYSGGGGSNSSGSPNSIASRRTEGGDDIFDNAAAWDLSDAIEAYKEEEGDAL